MSSLIPRHYPRFGKRCQSQPIDAHHHIRSSSLIIFFTLERVAWSILACARLTCTFRACAFRKQEDGPGYPSYAAAFFTRTSAR